MPYRKPITRFVMREISDVGVKQRISDGYFDASALCRSCDREFDDYTDMRKTQLFLKLLSEELNIDKSELVQKKNQAGEIWVHPQVAINLSQWAKPYLAVMVPKWVFEWMSGELSGVDVHEFDDVDPDFTALMRKAINFDPRK